MDYRYYCRKTLKKTGDLDEAFRKGQQLVKRKFWDGFLKRICSRLSFAIIMSFLILLFAYKHSTNSVDKSENSHTIQGVIN